jgi:hypothetical protein
MPTILISTFRELGIRGLTKEHGTIIGTMDSLTSYQQTFELIRNSFRPYFKRKKKLILCRVARWHIFKPTMPILGKFWMDLQWKMLVNFVVLWYILNQFGIFCSHLVYFVAIWYILRLFGIFCGHLVHFVAIWYIL